jgi:transposase
MIDCRNAEFSPLLASQRQERAVGVFGETTLKRIVVLALFFLGAKRSAIAELLGLRHESVKTLIKNVHRDGLPAMEDRRRRRSEFQPPAPCAPTPPVCVAEDEGYVVVDLGVDDRRLRIPAENVVELRTVILALKTSGLVSTQQAAAVLRLSQPRIGQLAKQLEAQDVAGVMDKRQGQQRDTVLDESVRQELVLQCVANAVTGRPASSEALVKDLQQRCQLELSPRTVRHHLSKLGLTALAKTLPAVIETVKGGSSSR